jgi:hypothetical protein
LIINLIDHQFVMNAAAQTFMGCSRLWHGLKLAV